MTPKEKAEQLMLRFDQEVFDPYSEPTSFEEDKQCALIVVDEILEAIKFLNYGIQYINQREYWDEVKEEIEKLDL